MNTFNELIEKAHTQAKEMGWWDEPRNIGELLMLIVSECGEALEAHRSGKRANLAAFDTANTGKAYIAEFKGTGSGESSYTSIPSEVFAFRQHIKDTFEDELADIVIRIADYVGHMGGVIDPTLKSEQTPQNVGEALYHVSRAVVSDQLLLSWAITRCFELAAMHNIDLWRHIELKLAYNLTRGHKHGKAY